MIFNHGLKTLQKEQSDTDDDGSGFLGGYFVYLRWLYIENLDKLVRDLEI